MQFFLVCDPNYEASNPDIAQAARHPPIITPRPPRARNSRLRKAQLTRPPFQANPGSESNVNPPADCAPPPYDLGWTLDPDELPPGPMRFVLNRMRVAQSKKAIHFTLSCYGINRQTLQPSRRSTDKKWEFSVQTDPTTKLLQVRDVREFPV